MLFSVMRIEFVYILGDFGSVELASSFLDLSKASLWVNRPPCFNIVMNSILLKWYVHELYGNLEICQQLLEPIETNPTR